MHPRYKYTDFGIGSSESAIQFILYTYPKILQVKYANGISAHDFNRNAIDKNLVSDKGAKSYI